MFVYTYNTVEKTFNSGELTKEIFNEIKKESKSFFLTIKFTALNVDEITLKLIFSKKKFYNDNKSLKNLFSKENFITNEKLYFESFYSEYVKIDFDNNKNMILYFLDDDEIKNEKKKEKEFNYSKKIKITKNMKRNDTCYLCLIDYIDNDVENVIINTCCDKTCCENCYPLMSDLSKEKCSCCKAIIKIEGATAYQKLVTECNNFIFILESGENYRPKSYLFGLIEKIDEVKHHVDKKERKILKELNNKLVSFLVNNCECDSD